MVRYPAFVHRNEADRLLALPRAQGRAQLGDRVARAFMLDGAAFAEELEFNALLATALREKAQHARMAGLWA